MKRTSLICKFCLMFALVLLIAALIVPGCTKPAQGEAIKIGVITAKTGPLVISDEPWLNGVLLMFEEANKKGGIKGQPIEPIVVDMESRIDRATELTEKLILQDKVAAVMIFGAPPHSFASVAVAAENKTPIICDLPLIKPAIPGIEWAFGANSTVEGTNLGAMPYFIKNGVKRVGILSPSGAFFDLMANYSAGVVEQYGMTVASRASEPEDVRDLKPALQKIKAEDIDALIIQGSGNFPLIALDNYVELGLDVPINMVSNLVIPALTQKIPDEAGENTVVAISKIACFWELKDNDPMKKTIMEFVEKYQAKYGADPDWGSGSGADGAIALIEGMKSVGTDAEKLRSQIESNQKNLKGVSGNTFNRTTEDHVGISIMDMALMKVVQGKFSIIDYVSDYKDLIK
jgi:branched-chain amino acid transport system substrate-binding protein